MTVILGSVVLSDDLTLAGPINQPQVVVNFKRTTSGRLIRRVDPRPAGRELVLSSERRGNGYRGAFTGDQADQMAALRDAGNVIDLVHHRGSYRVLIVATELEPIDGVADPGPNTFFVGSVTMIEV